MKVVGKSASAVNRVVGILMGVDAGWERHVQNRRVLTIGVLGAAWVGMLRTRRKVVERYEIQSVYGRDRAQGS